MSLTAYPTLRLKLTLPQALKLQFLPAIPGSNASAAAAQAEAAAAAAEAAANTAVAATTNKVDRTGDVMTGFLTLNADPTAVLHAATKQYVDAHAGGGGATVADGDYGDITVSGTGTVWTIDPGVVTFAKMQTIATDSLLGRDTAATGAVENITLNATLSMTGAGALQRAALTGDVTATAGSNATTIANDAVTYAKMQNASAASVLIGRGSASGAGDPQEIVLGTNLTMSGTTLNATGGGGTGNVTYTASSTAPVSPAAGDLWYDLSTGVLAIYVNDGSSSQWVMVAPPGGVSTTDPTPPQGRLTLQTLTPVMTTTQSAKTTIYYTPYVGNRVPIYDGTNMVMTTFAELSVATTDTTKNPAAIGASKVNDWFVWSDAGTVRIGHGPDWTSDTARSAGTALVMVNGILLNNTSITNGPAASRGTYVGTTRSNASSQLDWIFGGLSVGGTAGFFGVWNIYNRRRVVSLVGDLTDTWTYGTVAWRAADGSSTMRHSFVVGLSEDGITSTYATGASPGAGATATCGVGYDTTSAYTGTTSFNGTTGALFMAAICTVVPAVGFHFVSAIEYNSTTTASIWFGDAGVPVSYQAGLILEIWM